MALLDAEVQRLKYELGYNLLTNGAEPYIGVVAIFDQVIKPYLSAGASTTSATAVTAATSPTSVTLTLSSATGFTAGCRAVIDVDARQEIATVQALSGLTITALLKNAHTGTYPVTVEGGESIIRELLSRISEVKNKLATTYGFGSLKRVDDIEFYQSGTKTQFSLLADQLMFWRGELASALGIRSAWSMRRSGAQRIANY